MQTTIGQPEGGAAVALDQLVRCEWCMRRKANSEWEQMSVTRGWLRLCRRCANKRLRNPYNALLNMRKIEAPNNKLTDGAGTKL